MSYTITKILTSETIGDSLATINQNYGNLDSWLTSIQLSAQNYWIPLRDYYKTVVEGLKEKVIEAENLQIYWESLTTTVETNSAKWIEPIIAFYPNIESSTVINQENIRNWININYPVYKTGTSAPLYIENQKAYVYIIKREDSVPINSVPLLSNSANCYVNDVTVCTRCTTTYSGNVQCSNGDFNCSGNSSSCTECGTALCYYDQTLARYYNPTIQAYLNINFNEIHEKSKIDCLKYEVKDCEWKFVTQL